MGNAAKEMKKSIVYGFIPLILIIIAIKPLFMVYQNREAFFSRGYSKQYEALRSLYYSSQYVQKKNPGIIPDQALEAFAAGTFLKGVNPILITHDQPPLGRYILALSILIFDNVNTITIPLLILSTIGIFLIAKLVLDNTLASLVPVAIFINEPLFLNKFVYSPLLEPIQLPFIIFALFFFIQGISKKNYLRWFILSSIMLGFVISIRFFILGLFLLVTMFAYFLIRRRLDLKMLIFVLTLSLSLLILILSYFKTIQAGDSILHVFGIQKYIYYYHKSQLNLPFSFWDLLMFNRWHTWWGTRAITTDPQWFFIWPISTLLTGAFVLLGLLKKMSVSEPEKIILIWIIVYSMFLSLGHTSTRYFMPLLPFLYIISIDFLLKLSKLIHSYKGK